MGYLAQLTNAHPWKYNAPRESLCCTLLDLLLQTRKFGKELRLNIIQYSEDADKNLDAVAPGNNSFRPKGYHPRNISKNQAGCSSILV